LKRSLNISLQQKRNTSKNIQKRKTRFSNHGQARKRGDHYQDTMMKRMEMLELVDQVRDLWNIYTMMKEN